MSREIGQPQVISMAKALNEICNGKDVEPLNRKIGFILMVFPFNTPNAPDMKTYIVGNSISSTDMVELLEEAIKSIKDKTVNIGEVF